jgi:hypothetical protein
MVCFTKYNLTIPKSSLNDYVKYVLKGIYGFNDSYMWFMNPNHSRKDIKLIEETEDYYKVEFTLCNFTALINVLPETIKAPDKTFFTDKSILNEAKRLIAMEITSAETDLAFIYEHKISITSKNIPNLILQLANNGDIDYYYPIDNGYFICASEGIPLLIGSSKGKLSISVANFFVFDFDDGFVTSNGATELNKLFREWKEIGDLSTPVIPCNDLTAIESYVKTPNFIQRCINFFI